MASSLLKLIGKTIERCAEAQFPGPETEPQQFVRLTKNELRAQGRAHMRTSTLFKAIWLLAAVKHFLLSPPPLDTRRQLHKASASGAAGQPHNATEQCSWQPAHHQGCPADGTAEQRQQQRQQQRRSEREAAKAAAAARQQAGGAAPKPPKGPCGRPCEPPAGGTTLALPLASALQRKTPPWFAHHSSDLSRVQLLPGQDVLRVHYPAGSGTPSSGRCGGVLLRGEPRLLPARDAVLRFSFATAPGFDWTRGGKLGGGLQVGRGAAAGYRHSDTAASARLVWGRGGFLMLYVYQMEGARQEPEYAQVAKLGQGCGDHMFPGTFQVQTGVWNDVVLRVRLNTPGRADGVAGLGVNGQYREYDRMVWRLDAATSITTVLMVTFFGGSWCTPVDTSIDFANFQLTVLE